MSAERPSHGGPAFPTCIASPDNFADGAQLPLGMTLRDYFAAKAMQALLGSEAWARAYTNTSEDDDGKFFWKGTATQAYKMADAMLAAR